MAKYNKCVDNFDALTGDEPSLLYPELVAEYGDAALEKFRQADEALREGRFASRKTHPNGEPTLKSVKELIAKGELKPPTAAMVNDTRITEIAAHIARVKPLLQARLKGFERGDPGYNPKDKSVKDLRQVLERLENQDQLQAYLDLVRYADRTLREAQEFLADTFDAKASAASNGANHHPAALAEIAGQMNTFTGVLAPKLARENSTLRQLLAGDDESTGLNDLRDQVNELVTARTLELTRELVKKESNREGLTDEQIDAKILGSTDISWATKAMGGISGSSDKLLSTMFTIVTKARLRAKRQSEAFNEEVLTKAAAFVKATGGNDFSYMVGLDKLGQTTMRYLQRIGQGYYDLRRGLSQALETAGKYIEGRNPTDAERTHNIGVYQAKQAINSFNKAEIVDKDGRVSDGEHHRYTEEFKRERAKYQVLRQDGSYWSWGQKQGVDQEQYDRFIAKYYTEERNVTTMIKKAGVPTGELGSRRMRFTKPNAQEVVEERHRDPQYQRLLDDKSAAGVARLDWYNFFITNLHGFANQLSEEDRHHLLRGELPAIRRQVAGRYNSKGEGFLDWAGRLVEDPMGALKDLLPAVKAGRDSVRLNEDGTLQMDVAKKFTGRFRSQDKITQWTDELAALEKTPASPDRAVAIKKLKLKLTTEQNRPAASEGEMNLPQLLMSFGGMANNYQALKEQEGTVKLLQHAISHREYYEENSDGTVKTFPLGHEKEGQPVPKPASYSSQANRQGQDWLEQNYYADSKRLEEGAIADAAAIFQRISSMTVQGLNLPAALKNFTVGTLNNRTVAAANKFGLTKKALTKAVAFITADLPNVISDRMADVFDRNTYVMRPRKSIVDALMHHFDFLQHGNGVDEVKTGGVTDLLYLGVSAGEYHIQSQVAIAKLNNTQVTGLDGQTSDILSCYSLANGKLRVDPNFAAAIDAVQDRLILDVRNINKAISGNYAEDDKASLNRNWLGRLTQQYHKYIYEGFKAHWGREQYNEGFGENTKGYYRSFNVMFKSLDTLLQRGEGWDQLSEVDRQNLRVIAKELEYVAGTLALLMLAGALKPKPDDDDKHWLYLGTNFAERVLGGTRQELTGYANPLDIYSTVKNPIAGLSYAKDLALFSQHVLEVPFYGLTGQSDKLFYKTGYLKGDLKVVKAGFDLVPGVRVPKRVWEQIHTTGEPFIR